MSETLYDDIAGILQPDLLSRLREIFPDLQADLIQKTIDECHGDLDRTVEVLMKYQSKPLLPPRFVGIPSCQLTMSVHIHNLLGI